MAAATGSTVRVPWVDAARGTAIVIMIGYHLCFDLSFFAMMQADFNRDAWWLAARAAIVSAFLLLVGVSLTLAAAGPGNSRQFARRFARRELKIGLCALAVSAASYAMFPQSFIFFGILHFIFVASLLGALLLRLRLGAPWFAILGVISVVLAMQLAWPLFDLPPLQWIGFMTHKPVTEDYVPLFPWLGVVFLGIACGKWLQAGRGLGRAAAPEQNVGQSPLRGLPAALAWMGRHSLAIYMLHQPILLGSLYLVSRR